MLKRSLILISIIVLAAALLPLTGCSQATDSDGSTVFAGKHSVYGAVTPAELQAAADSALAVGEPLVFAADGTTIGAGPAMVDLTGVNIRIDGPVATSGAPTTGVILNAAKAASLTFTEDGALTLTANDVLIYADGMNVAQAGPNSRKVLYTPSLADITGTVAGVAVDEFIVDSTVDADIPVGVADLYVLKKVSVLPAGVATTAPRVIYAVGDVELKGNNAAAVATVARFVFTSTARLTNGTNGPVEVTLPAALSIAEIDVGGPTTGISLTGPTSLTLKELNGVGGPLSVPATTATIAINGGDGDLVIGTGAAVITLAAPFTNKSTGKTTFNTGAVQATTFFAAGANNLTADIAGDVEFKGTVATGATGELKFDGKVILADTKTITLNQPANTLTLSPGAGIYAGDGDTPLLTAITETVLTPAAGASLTVATGANPSLTVTGNVTSFVGNAQIVPEATLALAAATNVTLAAAGKLTLAAEPAAATPPPAEKPSVLSFAHASTSILTLGDTVITGGNAANTLTAHDAAVTFARNAITGATEGAKLASGGGTTAVAITVAAAGSLTLDGVNLDLSAADTGSLVLTGGGADGSVILKGGANPGKITVANTTTPITWDTNVKGKYLDDSAQKAQITGTGGVAVGSADSATANIGSISGGVLATDNDVKIAAGVNNVTITAGAALAATP